MLPKSSRLTQEDFDTNRPRIFFRSEIVDCAKVSLVTQKFACVVSKKTYKRAVDRNLIKRRIFHILYAYSKNTDTNNTQPTPSLIFYPKKNSLDVTYQALEAEIYKIFDTL